MLADLILTIHVAIVLFITGGLALVWCGAYAGWRWIRLPWLRTLHLGAIIFVAMESLAGIACPLTLWEDALRGSATDIGFVQGWVRWLIYYDLPAWMFTVAYAGFAGLVALSWYLVPPQRK